MIFHISLLDKIEHKRKEMLHVASQTGLNSLKTIKCSQELDNLLNLHMLDKEIRSYNPEVNSLLLDSTQVNEKFD